MSNIASVASFFIKPTMTASLSDGTVESPDTRLLAVLARQGSVQLSETPSTLGLEPEPALQLVERLWSELKVVAKERNRSSRHC